MQDFLSTRQPVSAQMNSRALTAPGAAEAAENELEKRKPVSRASRKYFFFGTSGAGCSALSGGSARQPLQPHGRLAQDADQAIALAGIEFPARQNGLAMANDALFARDEKAGQASVIGHPHGGGRVGRRMIVLPGRHDRP